MDIHRQIKDIAAKAKEASIVLRNTKTAEKDEALNRMAETLIKNEDSIIKANKRDLKTAKKDKKKTSFIDRLSLDSSRIKKMANCLKEVAALPDPVGRPIASWLRPNGLEIRKVGVPIGVIAVIYESRPDVTSDCVGICLKAGNALILRGGSYAYNSNLAIFKLLNDVVKSVGLPEGSINIIETTDRKAINVLLKQDKFIDLIIPRGGTSLIKAVTKNSQIPVIKHQKGLCHIYVDEYADLNMAHKIVLNAKVQRPSVCNAVETLLVHEDVASRFLPVLKEAFRKEDVKIKGDKKTQNILKDIEKATPKDWKTEYLDKIISIKIVSSLKEAIEHINKYSSGLSEVIITNNVDSADKFLASVDSAAVYLNASSRFTDGNQFGLGAEIGISTDKIHARGPMSVNELTIYKYVVIGNGQIRTC